MGSWGCGEKERGQIIQRSELWVIEERTAVYKQQRSTSLLLPLFGKIMEGIERR
jgi:hypothetical protein